MKAMTAPIYRWRVGEIEIMRVLEFKAALFEPAMIRPDLTPEIIATHRNAIEPTLMNPVTATRLRLSQYGDKNAARDHPGRHLLEPARMAALGIHHANRLVCTLPAKSREMGSVRWSSPVTHSSRQHPVRQRTLLELADTAQSRRSRTRNNRPP
jgi:hypothetical protein